MTVTAARTAAMAMIITSSTKLQPPPERRQEKKRGTRMGAPLRMSVTLVLGPSSQEDPGDNRCCAVCAVCNGVRHGRCQDVVAEQRHFDVASLNDLSGIGCRPADRAWQLCHDHADARHRRCSPCLRIISGCCNGDRALHG